MSAAAPKQQAQLILDARACLGEGPRWLPHRGELLWLDIEGRQLHLTDPESRLDVAWPLPETVGAAAPRNDHEAVIAAPSGLFAINYDSGATQRLSEFALADDVRFNDGFCDPRGRFWTGTMGADHRPSAGRLLRIATDGTVTTQVEGVRLSNGIGLSPESDRLYFIDSLNQRLDVFDFDLDRGKLSGRRMLAEIDRADGIPDGLAVDREGGIWVALFGGGRVRRFTEAGSPDVEILVPTSNVTACTFGDADFGTLYITTATWSPTGAVTTPNAGGLFAVRPGITGSPSYRFAG